MMLTQEIDAVLKNKANEQALASLGFYALVFLVPQKNCNNATCST